MIFVFSIIIIVALLALKSTTHSLGAWLLVLVIHGFIIDSVGESATHLAMFAGVFVLFILFVRNEITSINIKVLSLFLILLALMMISGFAGLDVETSLGQTIRYAKGMFVAIIISAAIKDVKQIKLLSVYCLIGLAIGATVASIQYLTGDFAIDANQIQRATGVSGDPNESAMLFCVGLSLSVYWIYQSKSKLLTLLLVALIFMLITGVLMTGSRGGVLTLLVVSLLLFMRKPSVNFALSGVVILICASLLAPQSTWDRLGSLFTGEETHGQRSLYSRTALLQDGLIISLNNPLLGVGPGNFPRARSALQDDRSLVASTRYSREESFGPVAHNMYLEFFAENGAVAVGLFLYLLYAALRNLRKLDKYLREVGSSQQFGIGFALMVSISAMLFASLFLSEGTNSVLWFLIGVGLSSSQVISHHYRAERAGSQVLKHLSA